MQDLKIFELTPNEEGEYTLPQTSELLKFDKLIIRGDYLLSNEELIKFLKNLVSDGFSQNIVLKIETGLKKFSEDAIDCFNGFKRVEAEVQINDVFERYDTIYSGWDDVIENLSLLSLAVHSASSPTVAMKCDLTALNTIYIDQILRFYYTDLMQLFPYIETKLVLGFKAFPKYLTLEYMPATYKKACLNQLEHYLSTDDEGYTNKNKDNFDEVKRILAIESHNEEFFRLVKDDIKKFSKRTSSAGEFERLVQYLIESESNTKKLEGLIGLMSDEKAFELFKDKDQLYILSYKKAENCDLRLKIFRHYLKKNDYEVLNKDLREMASKPFTAGIYPIALKEFIEHEVAQNSLKEIIPYAMNLYDIDPCAEHAFTIARGYFQKDDLKATNYFLNLTLKHNENYTAAIDLKAELEKSNSFSHLDISLDNYSADTLERISKKSQKSFSKETVKIIEDSKLVTELNDIAPSIDDHLFLETLKSYGWDCMVEDRNSRALLIFEHLSKNFRDFDVDKTLGDLFSMSGKADDAIRAYQQALESDPNNIYVLKQLAWRHYDINLPKKAKEIFSEIVKIDPNDKDAIRETSH